MKLKNLTIFELAEGNPLRGLSLAEARTLLESTLALSAFQPCPESQPVSVGFAPPLADDDSLALPVDTALLVCLQTEKRLVSGAALKLEVEEEVKAQRDNGVFLSKAGKKKVREMRLLEDLKKAQKVRKSVYALIDLKMGLVFVNTASNAEANAFHCRIMLAFNSFPMLRFLSDAPVTFALNMTRWIIDETFVGVDDVRADGLIEMERDDIEPSKVRLVNIDDDLSTLHDYINDGFLVTAYRLWMKSGNDLEMAFTVKESGVLSGIKHDYADHADKDLNDIFSGDALISLDLARTAAGKMREWFG